MIIMVRIHFFLYQKEASKNEIVSRREGERERKNRLWERERQTDREMERRCKSEMAWVEKSDDWKRHMRICGTEQIKRQSKRI